MAGLSARALLARLEAKRAAAQALLIAILIALTPSGLWAANDDTSAADTLVFDATNGTPIIEVSIKDRMLRFALDPLLGKHVAINPDAAKLLDLNVLRNSEINAGIDNVNVTGKLAKIRLHANNRSKSVFAALLGRTHLPEGSRDYDLAGGFEALPAERIIVNLNPENGGTYRDIVFNRKRRAQEPGYPIELGGLAMRLNVHFANSATWLDRRAAQLLVDRGVAEPGGEVARIPVWFGLRMPVQPGPL